MRGKAWLLAAAAAAVALAWLLLVPGDGPDLASNGDAPPAGRPATADARPPSAPVAAARAPADDDVATAARPARTGDGRVRGSIRLPGAKGEVEVVLAVRSGASLFASRVTVAAGDFDLPIPDAPAPLWLVANAPDRAPAIVRVPDGGGDVGAITLLPAPTYGGRLVDDAGRPVPEAIVRIDANHASLPSGADGSFLIPLAGPLAVREPRRRELSFAVRGRYYPPVPMVPEGYRGEHLIRLSDPGSAPRIRLVRALDGGVIADTPLTLTCGGDEFDEGRTDANGRFDPRWPASIPDAVLTVGFPAGDVLVPLRRDDAFAAERVNVRVPEPAEASEVILVCVAGSGDPISDAQLAFTAAAANSRPFFIRTRADPTGIARFRVAAPADEAIGILGLRASWRAQDGRLLCRSFADPLDVLPGRETRVVLAPGREDPVVWLRFRGEGAGDVRMASGSWRAPSSPETLVSLSDLAVVHEGPEGRLRAFSLRDRGPEGAAAHEIRVPLRVNLRGSGMTTIPVALDDLRRAAETGEPLDVVLPSPAARIVRVLGPDGAPVPFARVAAHTKEDPPLRFENHGSWGRYARTPEATAAASDGLASLDFVEPGREYTLVGRSVDDDLVGVLEGWRPDDARAPAVLRLSPKAELTRKIRAPDGVELAARLEPRAGGIPPAPPVTIEAGGLRVPETALVLYRLVVTTADGSRTLWSGPADAVPDPIPIE